jgi:hypothetical protein
MDYNEDSFNNRPKQAVFDSFAMKDTLSAIPSSYRLSFDWRYLVKSTTNYPETKK